MKDWYRQPKLQEISFWTNPYLDEASGDVPMVSYAVPIYTLPQTFIGVVKIDVVLDGREVKPLKRESLSEEKLKVNNVPEPETGADEVSVLDEIANNVRLAASKFASYPNELTPELVEGWLKELISEPRAHGAAICFLPREFKNEEKFAIYGKRGKFTGELSTWQWTFDYTKTNWYKHAIETKKDYWSSFYDLSRSDGKDMPKESKGNEDVKGQGNNNNNNSNSKKAGPSSGVDGTSTDGDVATVLTFAVPFYSRGKGLRQPIGVIALDVVYDESLRSSLTKTDESSRVICVSCSLPCQHCFYQSVLSLSKIAVCLRCYVDGLLPHGTTASDYIAVQSRDYKEWLDKLRKPIDLTFGQKVQIVHVKSGRFLSVSLQNQQGSGVNSFG